MKNTALFLIVLVLAVAARAAVTESFTHTYPLAADGTVHLDNVNGDIEIIAWDKAEVALEAEKKARTDEDLKRVTLEIDSSPTKLSIKTKYARKGGWFSGNGNASVRYNLMVPAGARLQKIDSVNSDITVTGVRGAVNLDTVNGRVRIGQPVKLGKVRHHTLTGEIGAGGPDISIETVNGSIAIREG